jgi:hypothetical protein
VSNVLPLPGVTPSEYAGIVIVDNWLPLSGNRLMRMNRYDRNERIKVDKGVVRAAIVNARPSTPKAKGRRQVELLIRGTSWAQMPDGDNSLKALTDALVDAGLLLGDGFRHLRWGFIDGFVVEQPRKPSVVIFLSDIGPVLA